jgi:TetR/AcrR family fatty acid metabolism transcriptional regulator
VAFEKRKKREKDIKKGVILKAARKLFFEKGFKSVTVDSIAKKAELSKGAVYLHFASKDEIYTQILLEDNDKFQQRFSGLFENGGNASDCLFKIADIFVDFYLKDRELFRILMTFMLNVNQGNLPQEFEKHIIKTTNKTIDIIEKTLKYGVDKGEFPPSIDIRKNRNAIWGLLNGIISLYIFTGAEADREGLIYSTIKTGLEVFIKGLKAS